MAFYDINRSELAITEFVDYYAPAYYLCQDKIEKIRYTQSSMFVEEQIVDILHKGIQSYSDFAKVMAWKIGKIKHCESQENHSFVYHKDWAQCELKNPQRYKKEIKLKEYWDFINSKRIELENEAMKDNPQICLNMLKKEAPDGIGTVYLITILFFLSHGKHPIYDRFAMAALDAYDNELKPANGAIISLDPIPVKKDDEFETICSPNGFYQNYVDKLKSLGYDHSRDRRLDQALWVYGHGFKVKQK